MKVEVTTSRHDVRIRVGSMLFKFSKDEPVKINYNGYYISYKNGTLYVDDRPAELVLAKCTCNNKDQLPKYQVWRY